MTKPGAVFGRQQSIGLSLLLALFALPWAVLAFNQSVNCDITWLTTGAARWLHGARFVDRFYEVNPPLSMLVYVPLYALTHETGLDLAAATLFTTFLYLLLSCAAIYALARKMLARDEAFLLGAVNFIAGSIVTGTDLGQRDQLLVFGLVPFTLAQLLLTFEVPVKRRLFWPVLGGGALLLLLKPHFALLPVGMLFWRAARQRRFSIVRDPDFIGLAVACLGYATLLWFCFNDYLTQMLPDIARLYDGLNSNQTIIRAVAMAGIYGAFYILLPLIPGITQRYRSTIAVLIAAAFACLVAYALQMKAYHYQLIPTITFLWLACGLTLLPILRRCLPSWQAIGVIILILSLAGYIVSPPSSFVKARDIKAATLTGILRDCGPGCRFIIYSYHMAEIQPSGYYSERENASRFAHVWYSFSLMRQKALLDKGMLPAAQQTAYQQIFHRFAGYMAEDLIRQKPKLVFNCIDEADYAGFFSKDPVFAAAWQAYRMKQTITIDYGVYNLKAKGSPGLTCDVYIRR